MCSGNIVKLKIGGTVFQTSKSTLTNFDGFFKTMLETGVSVENDKTGAIFVDRSPKHFERILNYMRDGFVNIPDSKTDAQEIRIEALYYLLDDLVKLCNTRSAVTNKAKNYCLETEKEMINAVMNSTKKAVIMMPYEKDSLCQTVENAFRNWEFLKKHSAVFDVYFYPYESEGEYPEYGICDKSEGIFTYFSRCLLKDFLKMRYISRYGIE